MSQVRRFGIGAVIGLLAGGAGVLASEGTSKAFSGTVSPVFAVADRFVDRTPYQLKDFAVEHFGSHDKQVLLLGVGVVVTLAAILIGTVGLRHRTIALAAYLVLAAIATTAALTDRVATASPLRQAAGPLALIVVGAAAYVLLWRAATRADEPPAHRGVGTSRRSFLLTAVAVAAVAAAGGAARQLLAQSVASARAAVRIPRPAVAAGPLKAGIDVPGITPYLTSDAAFYRVDTALQVPQVDPGSWRLRIHGMVDHTLDLSYADLLGRRLVEDRITLTCVSNQVGGDLVGNAVWTGVRTRDLLAEAGVQDGADAVHSTSVDGWSSGTPLTALTDGRGAMIAVAMNGEPLPLKHGFPARMVVPGLYGYVSATKWLVDLEITRFADFRAYWTTRGYSAQAPIKLSSRIDVPRSFANLHRGRTAVAGVAWAQPVGVAMVQVRVDDGPWHRARLAAQDDVSTWRQWVWEWDAIPGQHTLAVRATDATGHTQTSARTPIVPDGSTGWHTRVVRVAS